MEIDFDNSNKGYIFFLSGLTADNFAEIVCSLNMWLKRCLNERGLTLQGPSFLSVNLGDGNIHDEESIDIEELKVMLAQCTDW
jgi:hypothetical protein